MPVRSFKSQRSNIPVADRQARSRLNQILSKSDGMIRGTLSVRERTCGKRNCKCAAGEKHASLYLVVSVDGKYKQFCVPRSKESDVRHWVANYQRVQELLEEISQSYWDILQDRED